MSYNNLSQYRICAEPLSKEQLKIQNSNLSKNEKSKLRAVSMKNTIWPQRFTIYIDFINPDVPEKINVTRDETYAKKQIVNDIWTGKYLSPDGKILDKPYRDAKGNIIDQNNNTILLDPLEKICRDKIYAAQVTKNQKKISQTVKDCIKQIVYERIQPYVNLTFEFGKDSRGKSNIRISFNTNGCWSVLGTEAYSKSQEEPTMNFSWFDASTVIHEFGHALGLGHEHQAPEKGNFKNQILWNTGPGGIYDWGKSIKWSKEMVDQQVIARFKQTQVNDFGYFKPGSINKSLLEYDKYSIMLYFYPGNLTLNPLTGKAPGPGTIQIKRLSKKDVLYLNALYPGKGDSGSIFTFWKDSRISPDEFYFKTYGEHITKHLPPPPPPVKSKAIQLGFSGNDSVGFGLTIGLVVIGIIILGLLIFLFCKKIKNKK